MIPAESIHDIPDEFDEYSSDGFIAEDIQDALPGPRLRYRRQSGVLYILEVKRTTVEALSLMTRALATRFPDHDILIQQALDFGSDSSELEEKLEEILIAALRLLGVSEREIFEVPAELESLEGGYRATLSYFGSFAERYLVGLSLLRHHSWPENLGWNQDLRALAEEVASASRSVSYAMRQGGHYEATIRSAIRWLGEAVAKARAPRAQNC